MLETGDIFLPCLVLIQRRLSALLHYAFLPSNSFNHYPLSNHILFFIAIMCLLWCCFAFLVWSVVATVVCLAFCVFAERLFAPSKNKLLVNCVYLQQSSLLVFLWQLLILLNLSLLVHVNHIVLSQGTTASINTGHRHSPDMFISRQGSKVTWLP